MWAVCFHARDQIQGGGGGMLLIEIEYFDLFQNLPLQNKNNNHDFRKNFLCCALESFFFF